jgi:hypothetical protein
LYLEAALHVSYVLAKRNQYLNNAYEIYHETLYPYIVLKLEKYATFKRNILIPLKYYPTFAIKTTKNK